jgi:cob(I)alamin adenosyltransferase
MSIVTRRGDKGRTSLFPQGIVAKDDTRIELVGSLDELTSFLGLVRTLAHDPRIKRESVRVQKEIYWLSAEAVTPPARVKKLKRRITKRDVARVEGVIRTLEKKTGKKARCFKAPGRDAVSALLHVCRALCRRAERRMTTLKKKRLLKNEAMFRYVNRLSDLLFLMAEARGGRR